MLSHFHKILAILFVTAMSSFAIFGIGGHYAPSFGGKVDGASHLVLGTAGAGNPRALLVEKEASPLTGFGAKVWIDALPLIDIEANVNVQGVLYDAELQFKDVHATVDGDIPLSIDPGIPFFDDAKPAFGMVTTDFSIRYPFVTFPPVVNLIKLYVGGGYSLVMSKKLVNKSAVEAALAGTDITTNPSGLNTTTIVDAMVSDLTNKDSFDKGSGFHILIGAKLKPPIIPFAVYIDGKYHLGGGLPSGASSGFTLQLGAGLNI